MTASLQITKFCEFCLKKNRNISEQYQARCILLLKDILLYRLGSENCLIVHEDKGVLAKKICDYVEEILEIYDALFSEERGMFSEECDMAARKTLRTWLYYVVLNENKIYNVNI